MRVLVRADVGTGVPDRAVGAPQHGFSARAASIIVVRQDRAAKGPTVWRCALETMIGIGVLLVGIGILWVCFAIGVWFFTRTGREGMRIQRMQADRWREQAQEE